MGRKSRFNNLSHFGHFAGYPHKNKGEKHRKQVHEDEKHRCPDICAIWYKKQDKLPRQKGTGDRNEGIQIRQLLVHIHLLNIILSGLCYQIIREKANIYYFSLRHQFTPARAVKRKESTAVAPIIR